MQTQRMDVPNASHASLQMVQDEMVCIGTFPNLPLAAFLYAY